MMTKLKLQNSIDSVLITIALVTGALIFILYLFGFFSATQSQVQNTNLYSITSIEFSPKIPISVYSSTLYPGTFTINLYSSQQPNFESLILAQNVNNNIITSSSTCPPYAMFTGFPKNSIICTTLNSGETILPEGSNQYILMFNNAFYNITAYDQSNSTNGYISYIMFNNNGKLSYEKLLPPIQILVST